MSGAACVDVERRAGSAFHLRREIARAATEAAKIYGRGLLDEIAAAARSNGGFCVATNREMVTETGLSEDTIARTLARLAARGVVHVFEARTDGGRGRRRVVVIADVIQTPDGPALVRPSILDDASTPVPLAARGRRGRSITVGDLRRLDYTAKARVKPPLLDRPERGVLRARAGSPEETPERERAADAAPLAVATLVEPQKPEPEVADEPPKRAAVHGPVTKRTRQRAQAIAGVARTRPEPSADSPQGAAMAVRLIVAATESEYARAFGCRRTPKAADRGHARHLFAEVRKQSPESTVSRAVAIVVDAVRFVFNGRHSTRQNIARGTVDPLAAADHVRVAIIQGAIGRVEHQERSARLAVETAERFAKEKAAPLASDGPTIDVGAALDAQKRAREAARDRERLDNDSRRAAQLAELRAKLGGDES